MSQAHAQKYYELVAKDPALLASLGEGTHSSEEFLAKVVAAAKTQGLEFTAQEARQYVDVQMANSKDGELSDQQLEAVAGGKKSGIKKKCAVSSNTAEAIGKGIMFFGGHSWAW